MLTLLFISLSILILSIFSQGTPHNPIIQLRSVKYRGIQNANYSTNEYFGIRFAQSPTGHLRWKAPQPFEPLTDTDTIDATTPGPSCVQGFPAWVNPNTGRLAGSEDCLLLNVIHPTNATGESKLPVMATIHGGGYTTGDANVADAHAMLRHSNNAFIYVSIQYRLGAYGFMGSKKFVKDGGIGNVGLLDQRLALEWIHEYISTFGGDPEKVTLNGGSAGGGSVTAQMIMHGGVEDPPFRAAIAEFPWWQQNLRDEQLERQYMDLLQVAGCPHMKCLEQLSEDDLASATQTTYAKGYTEKAYGYGSFYYGPYVDGTLIRDLPSREFKAGHFTKVPMWVDRGGYEGVAFSDPSLATTDDESNDLAIQLPYADEQFVETLWELYPMKDFNTTFWRRQTWFGDFTINCPTYYIASALSASDVPVYKTVFNAGSQIHGAVGPYLADPHTIPFPAPGYNETIAKLMKDWFVSFAINLDPNAQSWSDVQKPHWPLYNGESDVMSVNYTEIGAVHDVYFDKTRRCDFFWESGDMVQN